VVKKVVDMTKEEKQRTHVERADKTPRFKGKELGISFGSGVREQFQKLYDVVKDHPDFDSDAAKLIKSMVKDTDHVLGDTLAYLMAISYEAGKINHRTSISMHTAPILDAIQNELIGGTPTVDQNRIIIQPLEKSVIRELSMS
jgi:hypothetical protein